MGSSGSCSIKRAGHMVGAVDTSCRVGRTFGRRIEFPARTAGAPWLTPSKAWGSQCNVANHAAAQP